VYAHLVQDAVEDSIDETTQQIWLKQVADALRITNAMAIDLEVIRPLLWQVMADEIITETEESTLNELLRTLGVSWEQLPEEADAFYQFVRARKVQAGELPVTAAAINLQKTEVCYHKPHGAFLENRVVRSYTSGGQRHKDEAPRADQRG